MRVIKPRYEFITPFDGDVVLRRIEECGRVCYKSEHRIAPGSAEPFVRSIIAHGHEAVLEHCSFTVRFICDRGVSHELVRHRLASFCQESTRYCNYVDERFGGFLTFIKPLFFDEGTEAYEAWWCAMRVAEVTYFQLLNVGCSPQQARAVLPNSIKTEVVMTANIREWRHILRLRCSSAAHPQMREIMLPLLDELCRRCPALFEDIKVLVE